MRDDLLHTCWYERSLGLILSTAEREREVCKQHHTASRRGGAEHLLRYYLSECIHKRATLLLIWNKNSARLKCDTSSCDVPSNKRSCLKCHRTFIFCFGILTACARSSAWKIQTLTTSVWHSYRHRARSYFTEARLLILISKKWLPCYFWFFQRTSCAWQNLFITYECTFYCVSVDGFFDLVMGAILYNLEFTDKILIMQ